jgi:predicted RND superfamily exporter protein
MFQGKLMQPRTAIVTVVALTLGSVWYLHRLELSSDLLCALPAGDPAVAVFREVGQKFGVTSAALVGATSSDLFSFDALRALRDISRAARALPGVSHVQSITELVDSEASAEGATIAPLIGTIPSAPSALAALRAKVLSREGVAGHLVSLSGDAALVVVSVDPSADQAKVGAELRRLALERAGPLQLHFAGAPFMAEFIGRKSIDRWPIVAPLALFVLVALLVMASGRGPARAPRVWIPVGSAALGVLWTLGGVGVSGVVLCGTAGMGLVVPLAVGLFAGSVVARRGLRAGIALTLLGTVLAIAAISSLAYFHELRPLVALAAGGAASGFAAAVLLGLAAGSWLGEPMVEEAPLLGHHRFALQVSLGLLCVAVGVGGYAGVSDLEPDRSGMESFSADDDPRLGQEFLRARLGIGETLFVRASADLRDPRAVRYLERLEEEIQALPGVSAVQAVTTPLRIVHQSLTGRRQLPDSRERLCQLWGMLEGNADVAALVDPPRREALFTVQMTPTSKSEAREAARRVEQLIQSREQVEVVEIRASEDPGFRRRLSREIARRLVALSTRHQGARPPTDLPARVEAILARVSEDRLRPLVREAVDGYFTSDEALWTLRARGEPPEAGAARADRLARSFTSLFFTDPSPAQLARVVLQELPPEELKEEAGSVEKAAAMVFERARTRVREEVVRWLWDEVAPLMQASGPAASRPRFQEELRTVLYGGLDSSIVVPREEAPGISAGSLPVRLAVTGPSLLLESAGRALERALRLGALVAALVATVLAAAAFRSLRALGIAVPALLGGVAGFGALGLAGLTLDATVAAALILAMAVGILSGSAVLAEPREGELRTTPAEVAKPLLVAAGLLAVLTASGFGPLVRFGTVSALALAAIAAGAAWLAAMLQVARKEKR